MNSTVTTSADLTPVAPTKSVTRFITPVARVLLGAPLLVFGLNTFLNFIPQPEAPMPERAAAFVGALFQSGYMFQLIGISFLIVGALLVANRFVPLALALFAPFIVNSIAFHVFLERSGLPIATIFLGLELYLAWAYRSAFRPMLAARVAVR